MSQLFCSVQQLVWPQPGTELTAHCASADFSSRSPGYQLREEATVEVWPARLAAKSDHDWSGQLLDWRRPWHCRAESHWTLNPLQRKFFSVNVKLWSLKWKNTFFHPLLNFLVSVVYQFQYQFHTISISSSAETDAIFKKILNIRVRMPTECIL